MRNYCFSVVIFVTILTLSYAKRPFRDRPPLVALTKTGISMFDSGTLKEHVLYTKSHRKSSLGSFDIHYEKRMVLWTENVFLDSGLYSHEIRSAIISNGTFSEIKTIHSGGWATGIAVDWINNKCYFSSFFTSDMFVINLDGTEKKLFARVENKFRDDHPFQIDPINRWIYFVADNQGLAGEDIFERVHLDNDRENRQTLDADTCQRSQYEYCTLTFAVDHNTGRVYWMDFYSSVIFSMNANRKIRRKHRFSRYELTRQNWYSNRMYYTIDKWIEIAYKGNVYCTTRVREKKKNKIFRLNTKNNKIISLPLGVRVKHFRIFHSSSQPNNKM
ncbi:uncharacterized protein LOC134693446 [Mytilus trossulus]|uniref:uncharacterized protein LOC134693446 n=1 Tax=Mytilus trossulus TaxID=6551 RepID=UPI0030076081